jgi:hypothetical protein
MGFPLDPLIQGCALNDEHDIDEVSFDVVKTLKGQNPLKIGIISL